MPSNHYEWPTRNTVLDGRREITVTPTNLAATSNLTSALDPLEGIVGYRLALPDTYIAVDDLNAAQSIRDRLESQDGQLRLMISYPGIDGKLIELRPRETAPG